MHHVFVSYSRRDEHHVRELVEQLSGQGVPTWIDQTNLPVSLPWLEEIRDAVEESAAFLICDSPEWRGSPACAAEKAVAEECGKPILLAEVGADARATSSALTLELSMLAPQLRDLTELRVRSRDWLRAGRPPGMLLGARVRRRLARSRALAPDELDLGGALLRASRRRSVRRSVVASLAVLVAVVGAVAVVGLQGAKQRLVETNEAQAQRYLEVNLALSSMRADEYVGLDLASRNGDDESAVGASIINQALSTPVPDDGFTIPGGATAFASRVVTTQVTVLDADGGVWHRAASATDVREAERTAGPTPAAAAAAAPQGFDIRISETSGVVELWRDGRRFRSFVATAPATIAAVAPSDRFIAIATAFGVEIVDVETGDLRVMLRGAPDPIIDLAWDAHGGRLWAVAGGQVVSWPWSSGRTLIDEPETWFQAIFASARPAHAWVADRSGVLREINLDTGETAQILEVDDVAFLVAGDASLERAVIIGRDANWIVDLADGTSRQFSVEDCEEGRPAFDRRRKAILVPCLTGPVLVLDAMDGAERQRIPVSRPGSRSVAVSPATGQVFVGSQGGEIYAAAADLAELTLLQQLRCRSEIIQIAIAPEDRGIAPVGVGTGKVGCGTVGVARNGGFDFLFYIDALPNSHQSQANAFLDDGAVFVTGFSDGTLIVRPTQNLLPVVEITSVAGAVRDMYPRPGTNEVVVVTRAGMVQAFSFEFKDVTNRSLAAQADRLLQRAIELGLAE